MKISRIFLQMTLQKSINTPIIGSDLRALRKTRGMTLSELATHIDRSVGWLSQVERGLSEPSHSELVAMANYLSVPVSLFLGQPDAKEDELGYVVRKNLRHKIGSAQVGLIEELLSPDLSDEFEVVHSIFQPKSRILGATVRKTTEVGYVVSGTLDLEISGREFTVNSGDSFRFENEPYRWSNPYEEAAVVIWVIAPPVY